MNNQTSAQVISVSQLPCPLHRSESCLYLNRHKTNTINRTQVPGCRSLADASCHEVQQSPIKHSPHYIGEPEPGGRYKSVSSDGSKPSQEPWQQPGGDSEAGEHLLHQPLCGVGSALVRHLIRLSCSSPWSRAEVSDQKWSQDFHPHSLYRGPPPGTVRKGRGSAGSVLSALWRCRGTCNSTSHRQSGQQNHPRGCAGS